MIDWICWKLKIGWTNTLTYVDGEYRYTHKWVNVKTNQVRYSYGELDV